MGLCLYMLTLKSLHLQSAKIMDRCQSKLEMASKNVNYRIKVKKLTSSVVYFDRRLFAAHQNAGRNMHF